MHLDISICIPVYNGSKHLENAILSALHQEFKGTFEILIVDDCSNDNSYEIAQRLAKEYPAMVRVIKNEINQGLTSNWNYCMKEAKGKWIKFLFQDDCMKSHCLQTMYDRAMFDKSLFVICNRNFVIEKNVSEGSRNFYTKHVIKLNQYFTSDMFVSPGSVRVIAADNILMNYLGEPICFLYHKSVAKFFGAYNNLIPQLCDYEFALRVASNTGFSYINEELVSFRVSDDSASFKNHSEKRVVLKYIEPLLLLHLFMWSRHFKAFRKAVRKNVLFNLYRQKINELNKLGLRRAHSLLNSYFIKFPFLHLHKYYFVLNRFEKLIRIQQFNNFLFSFLRKRS